MLLLVVFILVPHHTWDLRLIFGFIRDLKYSERIWHIQQ